MQKMVPCKGADEVLLILNNSVTVLTQNWEPCQADHAARPLLYQHHKSLVLQHQKRANKTAETEPGYNRLTYKNNRN